MIQLSTGQAVLLTGLSDLLSLCEDGGVTASLWVLAAASVGAMAAALPVLVKLVQKRAAGNELGKIWRVGSTWLLVGAGLLPAALFVGLTYYFSRDFRDCVSGQGFFAGLFAAWLIYLSVVVVCHLVVWRRELFGR